ncbi:MAG: hypothetical protein AABX70_06820, partial [Nanoarchaeota archaeon]
TEQHHPTLLKPGRSCNLLHTHLLQDEPTLAWARDVRRSSHTPHGHMPSAWPFFTTHENEAGDWTGNSPGAQRITRLGAGRVGCEGRLPVPGFTDI